MAIAPAVLAHYVDDIAFVAEQPAATTPERFIEQTEIAAIRLADAGIHGAEDLETAAQYLTDAIASTGTEHRILLDRAIEYLADIDEMVDEYRDMV